MSLPRWSAFLLALSFLPSTAGAQPKRVAVMPLLCDADLARETSRLRQALWSALGQRELTPLRLAEVDRLLAATRMTCTSASCLQQTARLLRAQLIVGGRLERPAPETRRWTLSLWLFDARQQTTIATTEARGTGFAPAETDRATATASTHLLVEATAWNSPSMLKIHSRPSGAAVSIDGSPVGVTDLSYGVTPGTHSVTLQLPGYQLVVQQVTVKPGASALVDLRLQPAPAELEPPPRPSPTGTRPFRWLKWTALGVAVGGIAAGVALLALHGRQSCSPAETLAQCPERRNTLAPGIALTAAGGLSAGASGLFFYLDARRGDRMAATLLPLGPASGAGATALLSY